MWWMKKEILINEMKWIECEWDSGWLRISSWLVIKLNEHWQKNELKMNANPWKKEFLFCCFTLKLPPNQQIWMRKQNAIRTTTTTTTTTATLINSFKMCVTMSSQIVSIWLIAHEREKPTKRNQIEAHQRKWTNEWTFDHRESADVLLDGICNTSKILITTQQHKPHNIKHQPSSSSS